MRMPGGVLPLFSKNCYFNICAKNSAFSHQNLEEIAKLSKEYDLLILNDGIYQRITYDKGRIYKKEMLEKKPSTV